MIPPFSLAIYGENLNGRERPAQIGTTMTIGDREFKYWAFISYSHRDKSWGAWLHRKVETYRVPKRLVGREGRDGPVPRRIIPVFRDREELPTSSDLSSAVQEALEKSRTLVVICSPHSAGSRWVNQEILDYKRLGRSDRILCLMTAGEPNADDKPDLGLAECFPEALRYEVRPDGALSDERSEPIAADVRPGQESKSDARLKVIAGILGVNFDALRRREIQRRVRRLIAVTAIAIVLMIAISGLALAAVLARVEAERQRARAEENDRVAREEAEAHRRALYFSRVSFADAESRKGNFHHARQLLGACSEDLRGWEWYRLWQSVDQSRRTLAGGKGEVLAVSLASDGRIFSGHRGGAILLWDPEQNQPLETFTAHVDEQRPRGLSPRLANGVRCLAVSADGRLLASASVFGRVRIWDLDEGQETATFEGAKSGVNAVAFAPEGNVLCGGGPGGSIKLWDADAGRELSTLARIENYPYAVAWAAAGDLVAAAGGTRTVRVWDVASAQEKLWLRGHKGAVYAVASGPAGELLASGDQTGTVTMWRADSGEEVWAKAGHEGYVNGLAFSSDDQHLLSAGADGTLRVWEAATGEPEGMLRGHEGAVNALAVAHGVVVSGSADGTVKLWDLDSPGDLVIRGSFVEMNAVAFSHDGRMLAAGCAERDPDAYAWDKEHVVKTWNARTGQGGPTFRGHHQDVLTLAFSSDGQRLVSGDMSGEAIVWDVESSQPSLHLTGHRGALRAVAFSPDGRLVASGGEDIVVRLWDTRRGAEVASLRGHEGPVTAVAFGPDGQLLASSGADGTVRLWNVAGRRGKAVLRGHKGRVTSVLFSFEGTRLISAGADHDIKVWDTATGSTLLTMKGHEGGVSALSLGPAGRRLVSGSWDRTVRLWDTISGANVMTFQTGARRVVSVAFSPDGRRIAAADADDCLRVWAAADPAAVAIHPALTGNGDARVADRPE